MKKTLTILLFLGCNIAFGQSFSQLEDLLKSGTRQDIELFLSEKGYDFVYKSKNLPSDIYYKNASKNIMIAYNATDSRIWQIAIFFNDRSILSDYSSYKKKNPNTEFSRFDTIDQSQKPKNEIEKLHISYKYLIHQ